MSGESQFRLFGKPNFYSIDFNYLFGAEFSTWNMPGAAPLDLLLCSQSAHGIKRANEKVPYRIFFIFSGIGSTDIEFGNESNRRVTAPLKVVF